MSLFNTMLVHINNPAPWGAYISTLACAYVTSLPKQTCRSATMTSPYRINQGATETEAKGSRERADSMMCLLFCHGGYRKIKGVGVILKERGPDRIMSLKLEIQVVTLNVVNISLL